MRCALVVIFILVLLSNTNVHAVIIHVPGDHATIQEAIVSANNEWDRIVVAPGTYVENIDFLGKPIEVVSSGGRDVTVIDGNQAGFVVIFQNIWNSNPTLDGFTLTNGTCGILCQSASPIIRNNLIIDNHNLLKINRSDTKGGGAKIETGAPAILNNIIKGNTSASHGGGIYIADGASPYVLENLITENESLLGGAVYSTGSDGVIWNNLILDNASNSGAGMYIHHDGEYIIENNLIVGNEASIEGGGLFVEILPTTKISLTINNCTLYGNAAALGGGIFIKDPDTHIQPYQTQTVLNTIIWENGTSPIQGGNPDVTFCNIQGPLWPGAGNINEDPVFVTGPEGGYYLSQIAAGQGTDSPCKDAGSTMWNFKEGISTRTDEELDIDNVDMGFHYEGILQVPSSWIGSIQEGIDLATTGSTVHVAPGTYVENIDFKGKAIIVKSELGPDATVIDGGQVSCVVYFGNDETKLSVLEGFTLKNGVGLSTGSDSYGGGIYIGQASPVIRNNIITENTVNHQGGGICCDFDSSPTITNNTIIGNIARGGGGGIYFRNFSSPSIMNNLIIMNSATSSTGGGIYSGNGCKSIISNNFIAWNSGGLGGGIFCWYSSPIIINNTIAYNAASRGGGFCCWESDSTIVNSIIYNNTAPQGTELSIGQIGPSILTIDCSDVKGGIGSVDVGQDSILQWGPGMIDADPLFIDADHNDFHIPFNSPCRGSGDNSSPELPEFDFEGDPRIYQFGVDIGADEFFPHLYITGDTTPGGQIQGKLTGLPGSWPVGLFLGQSILGEPLNHQLGQFWLMDPWFFMMLVPIPENGVLNIPTTLATDPPAPWDLYMQGLVGYHSQSLTNLYLLKVR